MQINTNIKITRKIKQRERDTENKKENEQKAVEQQLILNITFLYRFKYIFTTITGNK